MSQNLPSLNPIPDNIELEIQRLLQQPNEPALEEWLLNLIKSSGHMSSSDALRWRLLCTIWLAAEFDPDKAWPYLMWLNVQEATMSAHFSEILIEAVDDLNAHLQMAYWLANLEDERLTNFFKDFHVVPAQRKLQPLMRKLFTFAAHPKVGVWLAGFCEGTRYHDHTYMRSWRLLASAWYAAGFNPETGLTHLRALTGGAEILSSEDNKQLMDAAEAANGLAPMIQLIANCPDSKIKRMLKEFGHPDLPAVANQRLDSTPDYGHLANTASQARVEAETFRHNLACLEQANVTPKNAAILDLACGPLAPQTLLLNSVGYTTTGMDLNIPPGYLPVSGIKQWFKRRKHHAAWKQATNGYYQALTEQAGHKLKWNKVAIKLADLTRLDAGDHSFDVVICTNRLQHAPNIEGLLAEVARVLKPNGLFLADIRPYAALTGAYQSNSEIPWEHLREDSALESGPDVLLNKWREAQYRQAIEKYFSIEQWRTETDPEAARQLTPEIQAELADYDQEELTRKQVMVVARNLSDRHDRPR